MRVREKPPLRHIIDIETPAGRHHRWSLDAQQAGDVFANLRYSDSMPGGHENCEATLPRDPNRDYPDMERLSDLRVQGPGGRPYWEGRLERAPRTSGDQMAITPGAVGNVAYLDDNRSVVAIIRDIDLSRWQEPSATRRLDLIANDFANGDHNANPDSITGLPALRTTARGAWTATSKPDASAWYDSGGAPIGSVGYRWLKSFSIDETNANWEWAVALSDTDADLVSADGTGNLRAVGPGSGTLVATTNTRRFAAVYLRFNGSGGDDGKDYEIAWTALPVYGAHGLTLRGTEPDAGFLASDVVRHIVETFAPILNVYDDSIQQSSFVIPHLAFLEPTTGVEIVRQTSRFELPDWAVWDGYEFVWHAPGARGKTWRLRTGPSQLEATGQTVERLWNSIVVQYQDVDGSTRTVGPPDSGANVESTDLRDDDPDNPANRRGIIRRDRLVMGVSTAAGATEVGRRFLEGTKLLDTSGKARVVGWAEDDRGVLHPFSAIRSGDYAVFVDAADPSPRKIVHTDKYFATRTCNIDLDAPPEGLQQLLERLQVVLVRLGV